MCCTERQAKVETAGANREDPGRERTQRQATLRLEEGAGCLREQEPKGAGSEGFQTGSTGRTRLSLELWGEFQRLGRALQFGGVKVGSREGRYLVAPIFSVKWKTRLSAGKWWEVVGGDLENCQEGFK